MARDIANIVAFALGVGFVYCVVSVFRCTINAVAARNEGVSIPQAMAGSNILFKPDLYKPEARKWANRYAWSFICAPLFFLAAVAVILLGQWLSGEQIGF